MKILGLDSGAQIIILQGLSTYTALASAYLFARPVLRTQPVEAHREILSDIKSNDTEVTDLLSQATGVLNKRIQSEQPSTRRDNRRGVILLIVSVFLLTAAVVLQVFTDPSFHEGAVKPIAPGHQGGAQ